MSPPISSSSAEPHSKPILMFDVEVVGMIVWLWIRTRRGSLLGRRDGGRLMPFLFSNKSDFL